MGFAQEMRDFLAAAQAGTKVLGSVTDREYKMALTDALQKKTERDNDPESLALQDETARAKLAHTKAAIGQIGANTNLTNERTRNERYWRDNYGKNNAAPAVGSGLLPQNFTPTMQTGAPQPNDPNFDPGAGLGFADGGLVPFSYTPKGALQSQKLKAQGKLPAPTQTQAQNNSNTSVLAGPEQIPQTISVPNTGVALPGPAQIPQTVGSSDAVGMASIPMENNPILVANPPVNTGVAAPGPAQIPQTIDPLPPSPSGGIGFNGTRVNFPSDASTTPAIGSAGNTQSGQVKAMQAFAAGGLVEDDEDAEGMSDSPDEEVAEAPAPAIGYRSASTEFSSRERKSPTEGISPALVRDAARHGMQFGLNAFGLTGTGGVRTAAQKAQAQRYLRGEGGLTAEEMEAAGKAIDPDGTKFSPSQRNMAVLGSVYQYQLNKGNPEGAQRIAFQMLQHYRVATQRYAAIAAQAAQNGNLDLATKAAMQAYANIPDGRDFTVQKTPDGRLSYTYADGVTGKVISKGVATPQELASSAMGLAAGGFDKAILSAAGAAEKPSEKGVKAPPMRDQAALDERSATPVDMAKEAWVKKNPDKPVNEEYWGAMGDTTRRILSHNAKLSPREAFKAANELLPSDSAKLDKPSFKIKPGEDGGPNEVKFSNGLTVQLPDEVVEMAMLKRAELIKARKAAKDAEEEEAKKPGLGSKLKDVGTAVGNMAKEAGGVAGEIGKAWGGAIGRAAQPAVDAVSGLNNPFVNPEADPERLPSVANPGNVPAIGAPL